VQYSYIPWILEQEHETDFQSVQQRWRPHNLLQLRQTQFLLKDIRSRLQNLDLARDELNSLVFGPRYLKYLKRMHLWVREAGFSWQADQLKFLKSVAGFYSDYGAVLRLLKMDQARGKFTEPATQESTNTGV
jgi:hypothetical protein